MSRVLVIGGTLFIGRALVRRLLARGDDVTILHRGQTATFGGKVGEIHCDRNDTEGMRRELSGERFDVVYDNVYDWERGTTAEQVLAAARACSQGLTRYVYMSSVAAYGEGLDLDEDSPLAGPDHPETYVRNKADAERALLGLHRSSGFPAVTLRPPFIYGPENPFYREAFFWDRLLAGRPIIMPGDGSRLMQFVHVDDLAGAAILAAESDEAPGKAYNVAHENAVTQEELIRAMAEAAGRETELVNVDRETIEARGGGVFAPPYYFGQYFDMPAITQKIGRARQELGFKPRTLGEGLADTFDWYQRQRDRASPDFTWEDSVLRAVHGSQ
jgi:nucleoside-diphosphate-sugar epimerase